MSIKVGTTPVFDVPISSGVSKTITCPGWSPTANNLCILILKNNIRYSNRIQNAALALPNEPFENSNSEFLVAGWGRHKRQNLNEYPTYDPADSILHGRWFPFVQKESAEFFKIGFTSPSSSDYGKPASGDEGCPVFHKESGKVVGLVNVVHHPKDFDKNVCPVLCINIAFHRNWIDSIRAIYT